MLVSEFVCEGMLAVSGELATPLMVELPPPYATLKSMVVVAPDSSNRLVSVKLLPLFPED